MATRDEFVQAIAVEIERYVSAHPNAADSAEGIRGWWLSPGLRAESPDLVVEALDGLEKRGIVIKTQPEGTVAIYSGTARRMRGVH